MYLTFEAAPANSAVVTRYQKVLVRKTICILQLLVYCNKVYPIPLSVRHASLQAPVLQVSARGKHQWWLNAHFIFNRHAGGLYTAVRRYKDIYDYGYADRRVLCFAIIITENTGFRSTSTSKSLRPTVTAVLSRYSESNTRKRNLNFVL